MVSAKQARGPLFKPWWMQVFFLISKEKQTLTTHLKAFKKFAADRKSTFPVSLQLSSPQNPKIEKLAADMAHDRNEAIEQEK
jgi:hypothetical protein